MTNQEILSRIDHTLLKAVASWEDIKNLCDEALRYKTASVCIPPSYIQRVHEAYSPLTICTVIGFPLGYSVTAAKAREAEEALAAGALEIDMVVNIGDVKNQDFERVQKEIETIRKTAGSQTLKVIVETCYLTEAEKIRLCGIVTAAGADYIKTSTGFGTGGAVLEDILLFKKHIGPNVKIKAAGGIRTKADMEAFLNAGCHRIGTSSAATLL
ncbi:MAG: deoxyribose-phosphate aldolase [Spirochaetaceae bacterium]|jgi:deoxyribose-phosphate aldolase|nr:deoxyribose-phosphate aldolase [Spirochaetaceae bacterium]